MSEVSFPGYLTVMLVFLALYIAYFMRQYASPNPRLFVWHAYPTIFLAYFCSLSILLIVPLDVSLTVITRRSINDEESFEEKSNILVKMYITFFLITQVGYNGLTLQERYNKSGYFTVKSKLIDCVRYFAVMGTAGAVVGVIFFTILVTTHVVELSFEAVILTIVLLSNTGGLAVLMVLLGYGLVSFPQMLWLKGDLKRQLSQAQQQAASRYKALLEVSHDMSLLCASVLKTEAELNAHPSDDPAVMKAIQIIVNECSTDFKSTTMGKVASDKEGKITVASLAQLRSRLFYTTSAYEMAKGKVEEAKINAYYYEDLLESMSRTDGVRRIKWSFGPESTENGFLYHMYIRPYAFKLLSLICIAMSVFSALGVVGTMSGVGKSVSVYATIIHDDNTSGVGICVFVIFTLFYPAYVTTWSIFQMKIARIMELLPNRKTTAPSLSVNSRAVIRLSTPLAFFYLGWAFENGIKDGSWLEGAEGGTVGDDDAGTNRILISFAQFYQVQVIPVMGGSFNTLFPIIMFSVSGLVLFNAFNRVLVYLKLEKFQFGAEILTEEQLREGKRQLARHKRTMERAYQRKNLRQHINGSPNSNPPFKSVTSMFKRGGNNSPNECESNDNSEQIDIEQGPSKPPELRGWAEKKGQKKFGVSGSWQSRYFCVLEPGLLVYYKDAAMNDDPGGNIDLGLVMSFAISTKDDGDKEDSDTKKVKLELDLADRVFKMRFTDMEDAMLWRDGLSVWKEYCISHDGDDEDCTKPRRNEEVEMGNVCSSEDTNSCEDETAALTKHINNSSDFHSDSHPISLHMDINERPPPIEGWLEKKQQAKLGKMAQWQKRFFKIDEEAGCLRYFKSINQGNASGSIDLKMVTDISAPEKDGKIDTIRFNIDAGEKIYKIRAATTAEGEHWINSLNMWKDYIVLK